MQMSRQPLHVVQLRFTHEEWSHISAIARLRQLTVEELLREELRMSSREAQAPGREHSHLRLVAPRFEPGRHV